MSPPIRYFTDESSIFDRLNRFCNRDYERQSSPSIVGPLSVGDRRRQSLTLFATPVYGVQSRSGSR
jgi:hypothetical protein